MTVKYYVCDVKGPVLSVQGLKRRNYTTHFTQQSHLRHYGQQLCKLTEVDGLTYVTPIRRRQPTGRLLTVSVTSTDKDYWKIEGDKCIRVHVKPRLQKFTPTDKTPMPTTYRDTDPY